MEKKEINFSIFSIEYCEIMSVRNCVITGRNRKLISKLIDNLRRELRKYIREKVDNLDFYVCAKNFADKPEIVITNVPVILELFDANMKKPYPHLLGYDEYKILAQYGVHNSFMLIKNRIHLFHCLVDFRNKYASGLENVKRKDAKFYLFDDKLFEVFNKLVKEVVALDGLSFERIPHVYLLKEITDTTEARFFEGCAAELFDYLTRIVIALPDQIKLVESVVSKPCIEEFFDNHEVTDIERDALDNLIKALEYHPGAVGNIF